MKIRIVLLGILLVISSYVIGQDLQATVSVNRDSILLGNTLTLSISIDGDKIHDIDLDLPDNLQLVSGPNVASTMTMINGDITQTSTYTYIIKPHEVGTDYIPPMVINTSQGPIETDPVTLNTYPNPTNIRQQDQMMMPFGGGMGARIEFPSELPFGSEQIPFGSDQLQFDFDQFFGDDFQSLFDHPMFEQLKDLQLQEPTLPKQDTITNKRKLKRI